VNIGVCCLGPLHRGLLFAGIVPLVSWRKNLFDEDGTYVSGYVWSCSIPM